MNTRLLRLISSLSLALASFSGSAAAEQAGVSAAVRGSVELARAQQAARGVASGERIDLQDVLRSGADSGLQVLLLDETVFTLGADSEVVIDEFVYDPARGTGKLDAEIVRGVFRFVSGRIAQDDPDAVRLRLRSASIGIRGTIVAGRVADDGSALVVLLGPGRRANGQDKTGAVRVTGGGRHVDLVRANWATRLPPGGGAPSAPFPLPMPDLAQLSSTLSAGAGPPRPPRQKPPAGAAPAPLLASATGTKAPTATELSGQAKAVGSLFSKQVLADVGKLAKVQQLNSIAGQLPFQNKQVATVAQLSAITSGRAVYDRPGVAFAGGGGLDFGFVLDFGLQQASFGIQNVVSPLLMMPPGNGVVLNAVTTDFAAGSSGDAVFAIPASFAFGPVCNPCGVLVDASVLNVGGQVAAELGAKIRVQGSGGSATADLGPIPGVFQP